MRRRGRNEWKESVLFEVRRMGRMGGDRPGSGPGGNCVCPSCGKKVAHIVGNPCNKQKCPKCGSRMTKERNETK